MEGVLAAFAQFDYDVRSERTLAGMKAALSLGRWTFQAPLGYSCVTGTPPSGADAALSARPHRASPRRRCESRSGRGWRHGRRGSVP